jgi:hypothetical protein
MARARTDDRKSRTGVRGRLAAAISAKTLVERSTGDVERSSLHTALTVLFMDWYRSRQSSHEARWDWISRDSGKPTSPSR